MEEQFIGPVTLKEFLQSYWRKKPLKGRAGQKFFADIELTEHDLVEAERLAADSTDNLKRSGSDVVFVQQLDYYLPRLERVSKRFVTLFGCDSVWLDGMWANKGGSIGSHFDASDNFVVQLSGTKRWRLAPPTFLTPEERNLRMANRPGVGGALMPFGGVDYTLEPGDVLYLPLMWIHWGISEARSVSVSVVCNARCAATIAAPVLLELIARDNEWCKPLSLAPIHDQSSRWFDQQTLRLTRATAKASFRDAFARRWAYELREADGVGLAENLRSDYLAAVGRVVARMRRAPKAVDSARLAAFDAPSAEQARLRELQYRRTLKTLLMAVAHIAEDDNLGPRAVARAGLELIGSVDPRVLRKWTLDPKVGAWGTVASLTLQAKQHLRVPELIGFLAGHLVDLAASDGSAGMSLEVETSAAACFHFRLGTCAAVVDVHTPAWCRLLSISVSGGSVRVVGRPAVAEGHPKVGERRHLSGRLRVDARLTARVISIETVRPRNLAVTTGDTWLAYCLDRLAVPGASSVTLASGSELAALRSALEDAMSIIASCWTETATALERFVTEVSYLPATRFKANNETLELFRGLIRTGARHPFLLAQALVHEFAHNLLGLISDVNALFEGSNRAVVQSPFVHLPRNAEALLQSVMAFAWEAELTRRMLLAGYAPPKGFPIRKYVSNLAASLHATVSLLRDGDGLTAEGRGVLEALDACFRSSEPELLRLTTRAGNATVRS